MASTDVAFNVGDRIRVVRITAGTPGARLRDAHFVGRLGVVRRVWVSRGLSVSICLDDIGTHSFCLDEIELVAAPPTSDGFAKCAYCNTLTINVAGGKHVCCSCYDN